MADHSRNTGKGVIFLIKDFIKTSKCRWHEMSSMSAGSIPSRYIWNDLWKDTSYLLKSLKRRYGCFLIRRRTRISNILYIPQIRFIIESYTMELYAVHLHNPSMKYFPFCLLSAPQMIKECIWSLYKYWNIIIVEWTFQSPLYLYCLLQWKK